ncbi:MAG: Tox-REase-5 domain-containing protein [Bacteroidota bacterium]
MKDKDIENKDNRSNQIEATDQMPGENPPPFSLATHGDPSGGRQDAELEPGPGNWITTNESMSPEAAAYQSHVSGRPANHSYQIGKTKYDGFKDGKLLEAKSGLLNMVDPETGRFRRWFSGRDQMISQGHRQKAMANGYPLEWHFQLAPVAEATKKEFQNDGLNIPVIHNPN